MTQDYFRNNSFSIQEAGSGLKKLKSGMILKHNCENMLLPGDLKTSKFSFNEIFGNEKKKKRENPYSCLQLNKVAEE